VAEARLKVRLEAADLMKVYRDSGAEECLKDAVGARLVVGFKAVTKCSTVECLQMYEWSTSIYCLSLTLVTGRIVRLYLHGHLDLEMLTMVLPFPGWFLSVPCTSKQVRSAVLPP
jgi:hypothetical protein